MRIGSWRHDRGGEANGAGTRGRHGGREEPGSADGGRWRRFRAKSVIAQMGYTAAAISAVVIVAVGAAGYAIYRHLEGNITKVRVGDLTGRTVYGPLNILVLGSQERLGQKGFFGYEADPGTTNSDNLLLVHLDATHTHATVLSIPRDLYVYEPACKERSYVGYGTEPAQAYPPGSLIDGALNIGGPTCAVATVEALTGIKLDHVIVFDFNSFRTMVDALGGVTVCVPPGPGYHDGYSHLELSPGLHKLSYDEALAYVRTRHGVGSGQDEGGDLPRIQLQQAFISSAVQQIQHEGLLSNLGGLYRIADIATRALTVDQGLGSVTSLLTLARSLEHLKSKDVNLITVPTAPDTYEYPNPIYADHLMAVQPQDDVLYEMVRTSQVWHGQLPTQPYSKVRVEVENGTGRAGLAARTAAALRTLGFDVTGTGNAAYTPTTTVDYAGVTQADGAYTLMSALSQFPAGQNTLAEPAGQAGRPGTVKLILGANFTGVRPPAAPNPAKSSKEGKAAKKSGRANSGSAGGTVAVSQVAAGPGAVQSRNAAANICSGLPPAYTPGAQGPP